MTSREVIIRQTAHASYPHSQEGFAPSEEYPEFPGTPIAKRPNEVFAAVRNCFADSGLDSARFGTPDWSPLSPLVREGGRVFVLCNFVHHRRLGETDGEFQSKCTQAAVLRPILEYARKAVGPSGVIELGNAPVQGTDWKSVLTETGTAALLDHMARRPTPPGIRAMDLRAWILQSGLRSLHRLGEERASGVPIDLGRESLLEGARGNRDYRVLQYNPDRTAEYHRSGRHVYVLSKQVLGADLVISVPKMKTHQKVGVTCALKGFVGTVTDKDCLAHHRRGDAREGGDEFPVAKPLTLMASMLGELVWRRKPDLVTRLGRYAERAFLSAISRAGLTFGGSWHGNDTCWRMALDIARCMIFADSSGTLRSEKQREHVVVVDGVVGGEGDGPLASSPAPSRCVLLAREPFAADVVAAFAMGYEPRKLRLLTGAEEISTRPVTGLTIDDVTVRVDGASAIPARALSARLGRAFRPPRGWGGQIELDASGMAPRVRSRDGFADQQPSGP